MFDYENVTDEQINLLENSKVDELASAILVIVHGIRKGILTQSEGLQSIHNIALAIS